MSENKKTKAELMDVLFFISSAETVKPSGKIDVPLILKCADEAGKLDPRYRSDAAERAEFVKAVKERASGKKIRGRRFSRKAAAILVAAVILAVTALAAAAIATDFFGLFFDDPREMLEMEDGETRRIDDQEIIVTAEPIEYSSVDELVGDLGDGFIFPRGAQSGYNAVSIYYFPSEHRREATVKYEADGKEIQYTVQPGRDHPTSEELLSSGYERIETQNGNLFFIMETEGGYQGISRIGDNVYIVDSAEKEDVIAFIRSAEEL